MKSALQHSSKQPKGLPRVSYPHAVKKGSSLVTVYRFQNAARGEVFEVTWFKEGDRKRRSFRDAGRALKHAEETAKALDCGRSASLALSGNELESYQSAKRVLSGLIGAPPFHSAIEEYVAAKKLLNGQPLIAAIEKFLSDAQAKTLKPITVSKLVDEFIACKTSDGVSERYLQDCRSRLGRFAKEIQTQILHVKTSDMDTWLRKLHQSPRSRNNYRVLLVTMFRFARACGYLPKDHSTEADHIARARDHGNPIEIYSIQEMQALLDHSDEHTRSFLALAGFAGLRTAEILRLRWENLRWDQTVIEVQANMAKTAQRRLVPISPNLRHVLGTWCKEKGPVIGHVKLFLRLEWLSKASGVKWKRNALRHSFASYRLPILQDAGKLALEMGNSPNMVFRHYRELVTVKEAKHWFTLLPGEMLSRS